MQTATTIHRSQKGFTLVEMLIVLGVAGILTSVAIPGFNRVISGTQLDSAAGEMYWALDTARTEAIVRTTNVSVCARSTDTACSGNTAWNNGWLVFVDSDADGVRDTGEEILLNYATEADGVDFVDSSTSGNITFRGDGSVGTDNNLDVCSSYDSGIRIAIGAPGRITTRSISGGSCAS